MIQTCKTCATEKPLSDFPGVGTKFVPYTYEGLTRPTHDRVCRSCKAAYARDWRKANPSYKGSGKFKRIPSEDRYLISAITARLLQAKSRAKKYRQPDPDIDRDYLYQLYKDQDGKCALSGVVMKIEKKAVTCLSIDQITAGLGYIKGNVQWVAWAVNRAKGDMSTDVFIDMCKQVMEYQKVQRLSPSGSTPKRVEAQNPSVKLGEDIV